MYGSYDMRHTGFPQVDGGQRDPREMGRHNVSGGDIKMEHCSNEEQVADLFTELLPLEKFVYLRGKFSVVDFCIKGEHVMGNA